MEKESFYWTIIKDEILYCKKAGERISEHHFIFEREGKYGIIDERFNYFIQPNYDNIVPAFKEHLWVFQNGKWSLINFKEEIICSSFTDISVFKGLYACVSSDGINYGFINRKGEMIISEKYMRGFYIGNHLFAVPKISQDDNSKTIKFDIKGNVLKYGIINTKEELIYPYELDEIPNISELKQLLKY